MDSLAWARRDGEPALWYGRFEAYRLAGPERSLLAVYNAWREKAGKGRAKSLPGAWNRAAQQWEWRKRAEAWDAAEAERERAEREAEERRLREEARTIRRNLLGVGHNLLVRAALLYMGKNAPAPDSDVLARLITAITKYNADSREEYAEAPVVKHEVTGAGGGPIEVSDARERLARLITDHVARSGTGSDSGDAHAEGSGGVAV